MDTTDLVQQLLDAAHARDREAAVDAVEMLLDRLARGDALPDPERLGLSRPGQTAQHR